tara:strand:- start:34 stop:264 length:231 start_codon:yes stop_codon:yes gene_type:complete
MDLHLCQVKTKKGNVCGRKQKENSEFCGYHKNHELKKAKNTVYEINENLKTLIYHNHANNEECKIHCPKFKEIKLI